MPKSERRILIEAELGQANRIIVSILVLQGGLTV